MYTSPHAEFAEQTAATARALYAAPNRLTNHWLTPLDLPRGEDVRAPGEAPGLLAVESAMDELAYALGMDPIELRLRDGVVRRATLDGLANARDILGRAFSICRSVGLIFLGCGRDFWPARRRRMYSR